MLVYKSGVVPTQIPLRLEYLEDLSCSEAKFIRSPLSVVLTVASIYFFAYNFLKLLKIVMHKLYYYV